MCQIEAPRSEVFVDQPRNSVGVTLLLERKIMVDGFLAKSRRWNRLSISFFTSSDKFHEESMTNRLLHVECQKTFPDVPSKFHVSDCRLWSRLRIPQRLGKIANWLGTWDNFPLQIDSTS